MKQCPRDAQILATNDVDGYRYYSCGSCQGYFIPGKVLRKTMREEGVEEIITRVGRELPANLNCPDCQSRMKALEVQNCEIDICPHCHAIWLDRDEVLRIATYFKETSAVLRAEQFRQKDQSTHGGYLFGDALMDLLSLFIR